MKLHFKAASLNIRFQAPQFVDIPLDDEDSSDEEYRPDEEEEDETAEDVRLCRDCSTVSR